MGLLRPKYYLDLLIVVDENDRIKKCMHGIKSALQITTLKRIKHSSIFDLENEKQSIRCDKVLFMLTKRTAANLEDKWITALPNIQGDSRKYFVLYLNEGIPSEDENNKESKKKNTHFSRIDDVLCWWSRTIHFLFRTRKPSPNFNVDFEVRSTDPNTNTPDVLEFTQQIKSALEVFDIHVTAKSRTPNVPARTVILVVKSLSEQIDADIKDKLRSKKINGCHVYTISLSRRVKQSDEINMSSTNTYTQIELMLFLLHVCNRLEIINAITDPLMMPGKPLPIHGPLVIYNPRFESKTLSLKWPKLTKKHDVEFITVQHLSSKDGRWMTLALHLPIETTSYDTNNLDANGKHKFQLIRETNNEVSLLLSSKWFTWQLYEKILSVALQSLIYVLGILTFILNSPYFLMIVGVFCMLLILTCDNEEWCLRFCTPELFLWINLGICIVSGIIFLVCYFIFHEYQDRLWLLITGVYLVIWCVLMPCFCIWIGHAGASLFIPFELFEKANALSTIYYRNI